MLLTSDFCPVIRHIFASTSLCEELLEEVSSFSHAIYALMLFPGLLLLFSYALSFFTRLGQSTFMCPYLPQPKQVNLVELVSDFLLYLLLCWFFILPFILINFWNLLVNKLRFSISLQSSELSSLDSTSTVFVLKARLLDFFSAVSISFSLVIPNSCSLSLPKSVAVVSVVKSLVSDIQLLLAKLLSQSNQVVDNVSEKQFL